MVHRISFRVGSEASLDFWTERLAAESLSPERDPRALRVADPEGLGLELRVEDVQDEPLVARHPEIPEEHALQGFAGVRAFSSAPDASAALLRDALGFEPDGEGWQVHGESRGSFYAYDTPPPDRGVPGAGTVHHVAWASTMEDHPAWRERVAKAGAQPTPVIDRFWFRSIYFREPSGVLFEIATLGPGFTTDEPLEHLGESLVLPPAYEHLRSQVERILTPLPETRPVRTHS